MGLTATMRAVVLTGHGGPERLEFHTDWPRPVAGAGEVLVRVGACGLNNTDVNTRTGWYSKSVVEGTTGASAAGASGEDAAWGGQGIGFPRIQGADVAGHVEEVGEGVDRALTGRRVLVESWHRDRETPDDLKRSQFLGSERDGGFAEYVVVGAGNAHPVECDLSDAELATFPTAYVTAENMLRRASLREDDTLLVTGASGGVGTALIQLARRRGAGVVALCGGSKAERVAELGVRAVLPRSPEDLRAALLEATGSPETTVVADVVGGPLWPQLIDALAYGGRYVAAGAIAGPRVELDLRDLYLRDLALFGATIPEPGIFADLVGYIERGEIHPLLAAIYPLEKLVEAQQEFLAKSHVGNIVVSPA